MNVEHKAERIYARPYAICASTTLTGDSVGTTLFNLKPAFANRSAYSCSVRSLRCAEQMRHYPLRACNCYAGTASIKLKNESVGITCLSLNPPFSSSARYSLSVRSRPPVIVSIIKSKNLLKCG